MNKLKKFEPAERARKLKYAIRDVAILANKIEKETGEKVIRLNIGDPTYFDFDVPDHIKDALCEATREGRNAYTPSTGIPELKEAILKREKRDNGISASMDDVFVTNGLSEAIMAIYAGAFNEGEKILVPSPSYPPYISAANFLGIKPVEYATLEDENWQPDVDDIRRKIDDKVKAIVVINPNNPTGAVYDKRTLEEIASIAGEHDLFIISDEIYDRIVFEGTKAPSMGNIAPDVPKLILNGFSKVYLATGWRAGYIVRVDENDTLSDVWEAIMKFLLIRISGVAPVQYALIQALEGSHDFLKDYINKLKDRMEYSYKRIKEISGLSVVKPQGALYIFPRIHDKRYLDDFRFVTELLKNYKVLVVHGSGFGSMGAQHFRAVFLPDKKILKEAYDRIEKFLS